MGRWAKPLAPRMDKNHHALDWGWQIVAYNTTWVVSEGHHRAVIVSPGAFSTMQDDCLLWVRMRPNDIVKGLACRLELDASAGAAAKKILRERLSPLTLVKGSEHFRQLRSSVVCSVRSATVTGGKHQAGHSTAKGTILT